MGSVPTGMAMAGIDSRIGYSAEDAPFYYLGDALGSVRECQPQVNLSTNRRVKKSPEKRIMCPLAFVKVRSTPPILPVRVTG